MIAFDSWENSTLILYIVELFLSFIIERKSTKCIFTRVRFIYITMSYSVSGLKNRVWKELSLSLNQHRISNKHLHILDTFKLS